MKITVDFNGKKDILNDVTSDSLIRHINSYLDTFHFDAIVHAGKSYEIADIDSLMSKLHDGMTIHLLLVQKIDSAQKMLTALNLTYKSMAHNITKISKNKPVATLNSGNHKWFYVNYDLMPEAEKALLKSRFTGFLTKKNGYETQLEIYSPDDKSSLVVFYDRRFLTELCKIFDYSLQEGLEMIARIRTEKSPEQLAFIYLAFGDIVGLGAEIPDGSPGLDIAKAKLSEYTALVEPMKGGNYYKKYLKYKTKYSKLKLIK